MKNIDYIKEILIIIVLATFLGLLRNYFLDEPLKMIKEEKILNNVDGASLPDILDEPMSISIDLAYKLFLDGVLFIDARDTDDFYNERILNSINIPYEVMNEYEDSILDLDPIQPVVIYCSGGECDLSMHLGDVLFDEFEFEKVLIFIDGFPAWKELKYPTE